MDDYANKSCWGITAWAVATFGAVMLIAMMFGGVEVGSVVAANATG